MEVKVKCGRCKYLLPKRICGCGDSQYRGQNVHPNHSCDHFAHNPAQALLSKAFATFIVHDEEDSVKLPEIIGVVEEALAIGLPEDDEMAARYLLGQCSFTLATKRLPESQWLSSPEFLRATEEMERAVLLDAKGDYGKFRDDLQRATLGELAACYLRMEDDVYARHGVDSAIQFLRQKAAVFSYLVLPPHLLMLRLAERYLEKGDRDNARGVFERITAFPVSPVDELSGKIQESAKAHLNDMDRPATPKSGCFIATAVYGDEDAPPVRVLRNFRDQVLLSRSCGRMVVKVYYRLSPRMAATLRGCAIATTVLRVLLFNPLVWLLRQYCGYEVGV